MEKKNEAILEISISNSDFLLLKYFLTSKFYYAVIIDDYPVEISNEELLFSAFDLQARLRCMISPNWNSFYEGLTQALYDDFANFKGICFLFKQGKKFKNNLPGAYKTLIEIIENESRDARELLEKYSWEKKNIIRLIINY
mgnify:CR=1 FL=1